MNHVGKPYLPPPEPQLAKFFFSLFQTLLSARSTKTGRGVSYRDNLYNSL